MATMATSHGLSVYINSCIKKPIQTESAAFSEHKSKHPRLAASDPGPVDDSCFENEQNDHDVSRNSLPVRFSVNDYDVDTQLKNLTDEQFYFKLQELKDANRKTLEECEKLYKEKYGTGDSAAKEIVEDMFAARLAARSGHVRGRSQLQENGDVIDIIATEGHISSKPPPFPSNRHENNLLKTSPIQSSTLPSRSVVRSRPTSAPHHIHKMRRAHSLDDEEWMKALRAAESVSDDDPKDHNEALLDPELFALVSRIRNMWHGFKIDDYAPVKRRHSSASMTKSKTKETRDIVDEWRHRITIPKPFQMTLREAAKMKKKSRAQQELEEQRREKQLQEEEECLKRFKARPVPAHVYFPLYDEIKEKKESRRRFVKQFCEEMLKSQQKPFKFTKREEEKKHQHLRSATVAENITQSVEKARNNQQKFFARPVPRSVLDSGPRDKQLEDEEFRKIRIKMRAREMLCQSSLPPNMATNQKLKEQREKEKLMKAKQKTKSKHQRSSHKVPDYEFLYREFQKELARKKHSKEATVVDPFILETSNLHSHRERILKEMKRDEQHKQNTSYMTPRSKLGFLSSSLDHLPIKTTTSADLRSDYSRSQRERERRKEVQQEEEEFRRRFREGRLRKYILDRSDLPPSKGEKLKEELHKRKKADADRMDQYEKDLQEMRRRVEKRPLLFEQEAQFSAIKGAEIKFKTALQNAGLDEDFLQDHSSAAVTSAGSIEDNRKDSAALTRSAQAVEEEAEP